MAATQHTIGGALANRQHRAGQRIRRFARVDGDVVSYHMVDSEDVARCVPVRARAVTGSASRKQLAAVLREQRRDMRAESHGSAS